MASTGIHIKKSHQGMLRHGAHAKKGKKIPVSKLEKMKHSSNPATRKRATFALNARHWHHK